MGTASQQRVRVLYMIGSLGLGGAEGQLVQLIRHLDRTRFEPMVACMSELGPLAADLQAMGVPVHLYGLKGLRDRSPLDVLRALWDISVDVRRKSPHIVHTYLFWANVLCGLMAKLGGAPTLITSRRGLGLFKDGKPHYQWLENIVNGMTDIVTVNSRMLESDVLRREFLVKGKIRLIYNGVEWERFSCPTVPPDKLRREWGIPQGALVVGCVANLIPYKGHIDFIQAMGKVAERLSNVHLVLVGRNDGIQPDLECLADAVGLADRVHFLGSRRDVGNVLHTFDLQVLASHEEGFSNVILEGMSAGRVIVATNVGGNAEAIVDGITGVIVPPRDPTALAHAITSLLTDETRRANMGRAAQIRVQTEFSVRAAVRNVESLYMDLLSWKGMFTGGGADGGSI